jgi:hypothetical protein
MSPVPHEIRFRSTEQVGAAVYPCPRAPPALSDLRLMRIGSGQAAPLQDYAGDTGRLVTAAAWAGKPSNSARIRVVSLKEPNPSAVR